MNKKNKQLNAFTLAEVLITLGVIGVVAAVTLPVLIQKYNNHIVETRLKKVYTVMNQAILMSEAKNGSREHWNFSDPNFWKTNFAPYLKVVKTEPFKSTSFKMDYMKVYFPDGSLLLASQNRYVEDPETGEIKNFYDSGANRDFLFYPNAKNFNEEEFNTREGIGIYSFAFLFYYIKQGFSPYNYQLRSDLSNMLEGNNYSCNQNAVAKGYCTYYIFQNGWKIPKDYPFKVR